MILKKQRSIKSAAVRSTGKRKRKAFVYAAIKRPRTGCTVTNIRSKKKGEGCRGPRMKKIKGMTGV